MPNENTKYPFTLSGLYKNTFSADFILRSMPIDQQRADEFCAAIQACVGGIIEVREWGGVSSKTGKPLPEYKLEGVTAEKVASRKAHVAAEKAKKVATSDSAQGLT